MKLDSRFSSEPNSQTSTSTFQYSTKVSWQAYSAYLEGKILSEIECFCYKVQMNVFITAKEKWQLQHLSNYFHTERSRAGEQLHFWVYLFWRSAGCRYHTWFMTSSSVQKELLVVLGWTLSAPCYLTLTHVPAGIWMCTHKPNKLVNTIFGFSIHAILGLVYPIICTDMHKHQNKLILTVSAYPHARTHTHTNQFKHMHAICGFGQEYYTYTNANHVHINI